MSLCSIFTQHHRSLLNKVSVKKDNMLNIRTRAEADRPATSSLFAGVTAEEVEKAFGTPPAPSVRHLYTQPPLQDRFNLSLNLVEAKIARRAIFMRAPFFNKILNNTDRESRQIQASDGISAK